MRLLVALFALVALALPAAAVDFSSPKAVVEEAYRPYTSGENFDWEGYDQNAVLSAGLQALYAKDAAEANGEVGRIDFDPLVNGQDYDIKKLVIGEPKMDGDKAVVEVTFENFERPEKMDIVLVPEVGGYRIDDVQSLDSEYPYKLREILEAPLVQ